MKVRKIYQVVRYFPSGGNIPSGDWVLDQFSSLEDANNYISNFDVQEDYNYFFLIKELWTNLTDEQIKSTMYFSYVK